MKNILKGEANLLTSIGALRDPNSRIIIPKSGTVKATIAVNATRANRIQTYPIMEAADNGHDRIVRFLARRKASPVACRRLSRLEDFAAPESTAG